MQPGQQKKVLAVNVSRNQEKVAVVFGMKNVGI